MQFNRKLGKRFGQALKLVLSFLLVLQLLFVLVLAASPGLHHALHHDSDQTGHECLVTAFVKSQLSEAEGPPVAVMLGAWIIWATVLPAAQPRSLFDFRYAFNRGPPLR